MRIRLIFEGPAGIDYDGRDLYAALLRKMPDNIAQEVHDGGFRHPKYSNFVAKPIVYSGLKPLSKEYPGIYRMDLGWHERVVESIIACFAGNPEMQLGSNRLQLLQWQEIGAAIGTAERFLLASPVVLKPLAEREDENALIIRNLRRKYEAITGKSSEDLEVQADFWPGRWRKIPWGGYAVSAREGEIILRGAPELINCAYQTGIGAKNAMGFGMLQ